MAECSEEAMESTAPIKCKDRFLYAISKTSLPYAVTLRIYVYIIFTLSPAIQVCGTLVSEFHLIQLADL